MSTTSRLKKARFEELERQESAAYDQQPDDLAEVRRWESEADWPDDWTASWPGDSCVEDDS